MATATPTPTSQSFFFPSSADSSKRELKKNDQVIENPLLSRKFPAPYRAPETALQPLPDNNNNNGLRQRRPIVSAEHKRPRENKLPPRSSYSMGMGFDYVPMTAMEEKKLELQHTRENIIPLLTDELSLIPATSDCWVLVYGYATKSQYDEILRRFASFGHVLDHRGLCQPGTSNWIALQYESRLEAEKAVCNNHIQLHDGIFCGVKRLADDDPILLTNPPRRSIALWTNNESTADESIQQKLHLREEDVLSSPPPQASSRKRTFCEIVMRWFLSIED